MSPLQNIPLDLDIFYKNQNIPKISLGDKVKVVIYLELPKEVGEDEKKGKERIQAFEGVVIAKRNRGLNSAFTVRKISHGEGVERVFQTHSKALKGIEVKRRGHVRKAKLYYLRELSGKSARIKEKLAK